MTTRRTFIAGLGAAATWPLAVRAQQKVPVIGFLSNVAPNRVPEFVAAFHEGLNTTGFVEGQNVAIEYRWGNNQDELLPGLAADLVNRGVAVIFANGGTGPALVAKAATSTIPIVFEVGADPVRSGLVASFNRPGGNVTGVSIVTSELGKKRLEILTEMIPGARTVAFLVDPRSPLAQGEKADMVSAAHTLARQVIVLEVTSVNAFQPALESIVADQSSAAIVGTGPLFVSNSDKLLSLVAAHKLPTLYQDRLFTADGGLMSYGASLLDAWRLGGIYVGNILKGAKPADLPVQQPTKFSLAINLKTAKALGLTIPPTLLVAADEVIE